MYNKYILNLIIFASVHAQQVDIYNIRPIVNVDLGTCNDVWGYTAPDGHEFALVGHRSGTYIYDVSTNPHDPIEVGFVAGATSTWRDIKTHGYYCYVTNETGGGMDISVLRTRLTHIRLVSTLRHLLLPIICLFLMALHIYLALMLMKGDAGF